jgi:hypothetical protein
MQRQASGDDLDVTLLHLRDISNPVDFEAERTKPMFRMIAYPDHGIVTGRENFNFCNGGIYPVGMRVIRDHVIYVISGRIEDFYDAKPVLAVLLGN